MRSILAIPFLVLLSGCLWWHTCPPPPVQPLPPAAGQINESAKGAGEAIANANKATVAVTAAGATIAEKVDAASKNVAAMSPPLVKAEQRGGEAAAVAKEIKPLATAAAKELDGAKVAIDDGRSALTELKTSLAVATDRVKVLGGQVALVSAESQKLAADLAAEKKAKDELRQSIENGKIATENRWRNIVFAIAMGLGVLAVIALVWGRDVGMASVFGGIGAGSVIVYMVVKGLFKAEGAIGWLVAAAAIAAVSAALWYAWKHHPARAALNKAQP